MKNASIAWKLWACLYFSKSLKGDNFITVYYNFISFGQNVALVLLNKFVKFDEICLKSAEDMTTTVISQLHKGR